jgi:hypothetical protein
LVPKGGSFVHVGARLGFWTMAAYSEHYQASDLAEIGRGLYYIGEESVRPAEIAQISGRCITCRQQVWKGTGGAEGILRLSFRKSAMQGYLVSCSVPKSKQRRQLLCLGCVGKLMGELRVSADAQSVSLCERGHGQQDGLLFERQASGSWRLRLELTDELLEGAVAANESSVSRKKPRKVAADTRRGLQAGKRPRAEPVSAHAILIFSLGCMCKSTECRKSIREYAAAAARGERTCELFPMQSIQRSLAAPNSPCTSCQD